MCCVGAAADDAQQLLRMLCTGTYHVPADRCSRPYMVATSVTQVCVAELQWASDVRVRRVTWEGRWRRMRTGVAVWRCRCVLLLVVAVVVMMTMMMMMMMMMMMLMTIMTTIITITIITIITMHPGLDPRAGVASEQPCAHCRGWCVPAALRSNPG